ncbi:MAG: mandelate racemase/muconate lactonizing enzyme family protein [Halobacteriaceae archaeon]
MSDLSVSGVEWYRVDGDRPWVFVRVETDAGVHGVGEVPLRPAANSLDQLERMAAEHLLGADPFETADLLRTRGLSGAGRNNVLGTTILGGFDVACWDLKGRHLGAPVHELLGGKVHGDWLRAYANGWDFEARDVVSAYHEGEDAASVLEDTRAVITEAAEAVVDAGYDALKFSPFQWGTGPTTTGAELDRALDVVAAVDEAVGPDVELLVEGHKNLSREKALRAARRLAEFDPGFYEEPVHADVNALRRVARHSPVPVATGESITTHHGYADLIYDTDVSVVQPDVVRSGGITELARVAAMASAERVGFAPHNAAGPVMTAAAVQVDATAPAFMIQESFEEFSHPEWTDDLLTASLTVEDGRVRVPDRPGIGVDLDVDAVRERAVASGRVE